KISAVGEDLDREVFEGVHANNPPKYRRKRHAGKYFFPPNPNSLLKFFCAVLFKVSVVEFR
ncbi:MAG TPA: hypothetical protein VN957_24105, partial [Chthoniobacterales bacterium]|nr:hypothetical protein [Chthoniobacterales bacterium]